MDPVLSGVVLLLLIALGRCWSLAHVVLSLLIDPDTVSAKDSSLFGVFSLNFSDRLSFWLHIVEGRCEVDIDIGVDDADGVVLILGSDFEDVNFKFILEDLDADCVSLVQACEVSELVLEDGFGVLHVYEFGLVGL